jgi:23S rRNA pseudouridine2605 synthase
VKERVQKLMAQANIASRRAAESLIEQGRVRVNGKVIKLGDQADPLLDMIEVDGQKLVFSDTKTYIAVNKPRNVLSTTDPHEGDGRRTVRDLIPVDGHLFSIGRLDADSEGLMVFTNDGELANRLSHPRYRHTKTYKVVVHGLPTLETIERWQKGITLIDEDGTSYTTKPCYVKITDGGRETTLRIVMTEGKKRQIRRVASALGHNVITLVRTHLGRLQLGTIRPGEWRELDANDLKFLKMAAPELPDIAKSTAPHRPRRAESGEEQAERPPARKPAAKRPERKPAPPRGGRRSERGGDAPRGGGKPRSPKRTA